MQLPSDVLHYIDSCDTFFSHQQQVLSRDADRVGEGVIILILHKLLGVGRPHFDLKITIKVLSILAIPVFNPMSGPIGREKCRFQPRFLGAMLLKAHLVLRDLHVEDDVVDELGQRFLHRALELAVVQQCVDKLKDTEHQILKAQHLTYGRKRRRKRAYGLDPGSFTL